VFGQLRTAQAATPFLTKAEVAATLALFSVVYTLIFLFGTWYIYQLLRRGPVSPPVPQAGYTNPKRPLSIPGDSIGASRTSLPTLPESVS
jgi:cytochrome d ubiquinol oxidase subunit I